MSELINSLVEALRTNPGATPLRLHLAELLIEDGQATAAISELGTILGKDPSNSRAQELLRHALAPAPNNTQVPPSAPAQQAGSGSAPTISHAGSAHESGASPDTYLPDSDPTPSAMPSAQPEPSGQAAALDWARLEQEVGSEIAAPFITDGTGYEADLHQPHHPHQDDLEGPSEENLIFIRDSEDAKFFEEPQPERIKLADVGGLTTVKERLRLAFLEPMRNPEIAKAYGKSLKGGLLLYGPPGTGKTFLARAVAGELDAKFLSITIADVLDGIMGESEKNVRRIFDRARELAPCVLFIDELDSLGGKRSGYSNMGWMRNVVNQILQEMDGVGANNDGVFILAATNHPWDIDNALLRPGRFDRVVLVTAPDPEARATILKLAFKDRPIAGIDLDEAVAATHGFSGADLTHLVASAAERAMSDSIARGELRPINMEDLRAALAEVKPSIGPWLQSARNVVDFANADGRYDDLKEYLEAEQKLKHKKSKW